MTPPGPLPPEDEVIDRLHRHLRSWLGAWPPTAELTVVASLNRTAPGWDGRVRTFAGVSTPEGTVLSVPLGALDAVRGAGSTLEEVLAALPDALGQPDGVVGRGVYRFCLTPAPIDAFGDPVGEWLDAEDEDVPAWLRPFGGRVLIVREDGQYVAGLGIKRHDDLGQEVAVATEEPWRGRGLARALVGRAAGDILRQGGVPIYFHGRANAASARVAETSGFGDRGWLILGLPTAS